MGRYAVAPIADEDIDEILDYIAADNLDAALRFNERLIELFELLADNPKAGRLRPDLGTGLRSFPGESYLIFYRELPAFIEITRVLHAARDIDELFS